MFCTACGKEFGSEEDAFCRNCGAPKFVPPEPKSPTGPGSLRATSQLKQTTSSLLRRVGTVKRSGSAISKKIPRHDQPITQKKFLREMDSYSLAKYLDREFRAEGFETRTNGTPDDLYIEISRMGTTKIVAGIYQPITIRIQVDSETTTISLGRAKWDEKKTMQKFGTIVFLPLALTRNYGITQDKMPEKIWKQVDKFLASDNSGSTEEIVMEGHGQAVDPRFFGGRNFELGVFESRLESTIQGHPRHLALTGEAGIGKSSTLRKFEQIAKDRECLTVRRELDSTVSTVKDLSTFLLEAFRSECYAKLSKRAETWDKTKDFFKKRSISVAGPGLGSISVSSPSETTNFVLQESFFKEAMRLWAQLNRNDIACVVFFLDEADQVQNVEGGWRFLKSVVTRLSEAGGKFMLTVAGSPDFLRPTATTSLAGSRTDGPGSYSPIDRFLHPILLKAMSLEEIKDVLNKAVTPLGRSLTPEAVQRVFEISGGQPYLAQNLAFVASSNESRLRPISDSMIDSARGAVAENLAAFFSERLENISEEDRRILLVLSQGETPMAAREVGRKLRSMDSAVLTNRLKGLVRAGLVRETSLGLYCVFSSLFASFVRDNMTFEIKQPAISKRK